MLSLGYDIGSSSIKCSILDCENGRTIARGFYPPNEMEIQSPYPGWAEQEPELWWQHIITVTQQLLRANTIDPASIKAIGISYQMHGLVLVDKQQKVLRPSIIWCDSRAVDIGRAAFETLGEEFCLQHLLNSPGNFTAAKLKWIKEHETQTFKKIYKAMLPGDFIAMKLTGEISTTVPGLSEGIYWDFKKETVSNELLEYFGIEASLLPHTVETFSEQGRVTKSAAEQLGLAAGTPVSYRAGDQPNNAFSLNVLNPGDIAATAGTSGVVYGIANKLTYDRRSRVNPFAHVNHTTDQLRLGVLLCINGTGILNSWLRKNIAGGLSYDDLNASAAKVPIGSEGVVILPFGNGSERMLENKNIGSHILGLDFNRHSRAHIFRAAQEGIAFSFKYGIDILREMSMDIRVIRAGDANMFLSPLFRETLATISGARIELYETDGAQGAARGAAIGAGLFTSFENAFASLLKKGEVHPSISDKDATHMAYDNWMSALRPLQ